MSEITCIFFSVLEVGFISSVIGVVFGRTPNATTLYQCGNLTLYVILHRTCNDIIVDCDIITDVVTASQFHTSVDGV